MPERAPDDSTIDGATHSRGGLRADACVPALALAWSLEEPSRVGELFCLPRAADDVPFSIGRAVRADDSGALPLVLEQLRPHERRITGPLRDGRISRRHLGVRALAEGGLLLEKLGRGSLKISGHEVERAIATRGDVIIVAERLALRVTERPAGWPRPGAPPAAFPFGEADRDGIVGESPAAWELRRQIAAFAPLDEHVLLFGPSGSGKELVIQALHRASARAKGPLVSRNAATIPESLIDAELFGNLRDYPNPGTPGRPGLLGEADGGALFLDELGELPHPLQARLLRVMDSGEYQRLGEAKRRRSDVRVLGATNRDPSELKHDVLARFALQLRVPGLDERADDIPLLVRHLLLGFGRAHPAGEPRIAADFVADLLQHRYVGHVRELRGLLRRAWTESEDAVLRGPPGFAAPRPAPRQPTAHTSPGDLSAEAIMAALAACDGVRERAWRALGLRSRYQLKRLLAKHGIS